MIVEVMLTDTSHAINQSFDYLVPKELEASMQSGLRVLVPFGVHNTTAEALVIACKEDSTFSRLKSVIRPLDAEPICSKELLDLCFWMERRYFCSFQQAYQRIKPPHMGTEIRKWLILKQESTEQKLTPTQQLVLDKLKELDGIAELEELEAELNRKGLIRSAVALQDMGLVTIQEKIDDTISFTYVRKAHLNPDIEDGYALSDELRSRRATTQADMILALCDNGDMTTSDLVMICEGSYSSLNALRDKGIISIYREQVERSAYQKDAYAPDAGGMVNRSMFRKSEFLQLGIADAAVCLAF